LNAGDGINIKFNINMIREIQTFTFVGYSDLVAKLGGIKAALSPVMDLATPILILTFLIGLSQMIREIYKAEYIKYLKEVIEKYF
jgi:hypothetical protein